MADKAKRCTEPGCTSPRFKKVSEEENLCYHHLKAKHPELLPRSMRPRSAAPPRKPAPPAPPRASLKPSAPTSDGALNCRTCGQRLPKRVQKAVRLLLRNGVEDLDVAVKAATLVLQVT